jgi:Na+/melibiose symporter-like transporter
MAPIMMIVAPMTPRISARIGANRTVGVGMLLLGSGFALIRLLDVDSNAWMVLVALIPMTCGMAMSMSPMTAAIMSAVPARRAGAGSAMNDATRELGAALGIAVLGSITASHYSSALDGLTSGLPDAARETASSSIAGALQVASQLPGQAGEALRVGAESAFVDGLHFAVTVGAALALGSAALVWRFLPRQLAHEGAMHGAAEAAEDAAELGLAGVLPVFPDTPGSDEERALLDDERPEADDRCDRPAVAGGADLV